MTSSAAVLFVAVLLASAVEAVEAVTIVVAVGFTRGWRSAFEGTVAAVVVLSVLVGTLGPALVRLVPLGTLRLVVGSLLLVFGLQWLRKAVLRATGYLPKHDEDAIFKREVDGLSAGGLSAGGLSAGGLSAAEPSSPAVVGQDRRSRSPHPRDATAFTVAFKGVFLEGMEVVVLVISLGSTSHRLGLAVLAAAIAVAIVTAAGAVVAKQLSGVPENAMKMAVGLMLVSFGTFWGAAGAGLNWPGSDLAIVALLAFYALAVAGVVGALDRTHKRLLLDKANGA